MRAMDSRHDFTLEKVFWGYFGALDQKANSALLMALLSGSSTEPVEMIAVDSGAGEHFIKPGHAKLLSGLQQSRVSAIGVSGAPIKASNTGRLLVKLLDRKSGLIFTMDLGRGNTLPDLPVSLLSVSSKAKREDESS